MRVETREVALSESARGREQLALRNPLLRRMAPEARAAFLRRGVIERYDEKQVVFSLFQESSFFVVVLEGALRVRSELGVLTVREGGVLDFVRAICSAGRKLRVYDCFTKGPVVLLLMGRKGYQRMQADLKLLHREHEGRLVEVMCRQADRSTIRGL
jgi:hypothetical protein